MESRQRIVMVAAYGRNRVIGDRGRIPWDLPEDLAHFRAVTSGHTLVMGRTTYDGIGRPLPGRTTVVLTRDPDWSAEGVLVAHGLEEALELAAGEQGDTIIAGGSTVYRQAMPHATHQVLSEVHLSPDGDAHYPEVDPEEWIEVHRERHRGFDAVWWERLPPHAG